MTAPNIAWKVCRGTPSQSAQVPYSLVSSTRHSPTSKTTARIMWAAYREAPTSVTMVRSTSNGSAGAPGTAVVMDASVVLVIGLSMLAVIALPLLSEGSARFVCCLACAGTGFCIRTLGAAPLRLTGFRGDMDSEHLERGVEDTGWHYRNWPA